MKEKEAKKELTDFIRSYHTLLMRLITPVLSETQKVMILNIGEYGFTFFAKELEKHTLLQFPENKEKKKGSIKQIMKEVLQARLDTNLTQTELAKAVSMTQVQISNIEKGKSIPQAKNRRKLEEVLGCQINWDFKQKKKRVLPSPIKQEVKKRKTRSSTYVMPFGKYKGFKISEVKEIEPQYIRWLLSTWNHEKNGLYKALQRAIKVPKKKSKYKRVKKH